MAIRVFHMTTTFEVSKGKFESPMTDKKRKVGRILDMLLLILIGVHISFNPFPQITAIEEISFYGSVLILFVLLSLKKTTFSLKTPLTTPFILFVLWAIFGLFFAFNKPNSIHDIYAHLLKYLMVFFLLVNYFNSFKRFKILAGLIVLSTTIFASYLLVYFYLILGYPIGANLGYKMPWEIPSNIIGILTLYSMLLAVYMLDGRKDIINKLLIGLALVILAFTTLATQTRGTILAMFVSIAICFRTKKHLFLLFLLFLISLSIIMPVKDRLKPEMIYNKILHDDRGQIWYTFWEMIKTHPVTGIGFGMQTYNDENLLKKYNQLVPSSYRQPVPHKAPHNLIVDITVRTGFTGLVLFMFIIYRFLWMTRETIKNGRTRFVRTWAVGILAAFAAWMIQGMFENTASGSAAMIFFILLAMMTILWNLREETENLPEGLIEK
jgi:putative inorganic carbon (HCO3(-)) transporter